MSERQLRAKRDDLLSLIWVLGTRVLAKLVHSLDANNFAIFNVRTLTYFAVFDNGNSGAAKTIDWTVAQKQKIALTGSPNAVLTFVDPIGPCNVEFKVVQGAGGNKTASWPGSVKWPGGTPPTLSTTAGAIDLVSFFWDGTEYLGQAAPPGFA